MAFGKKLKTLRDRLDITQEALAERSGVAQATISALERRDSERSRYAIQLATALGVTVEQMHNLSDDMLYAQATRRASIRPQLAAGEPDAMPYYTPPSSNRDALLRLFDELTAPQVAIVLEQIRSFVDANRLVLQTFAARDGNDTPEGDHA
jgi:transcriptional regulator with XRE-family HTH domain